MGENPPSKAQRRDPNPVQRRSFSCSCPKDEIFQTIRYHSPRPWNHDLANYPTERRFAIRSLDNRGIQVFNLPVAFGSIAKLRFQDQKRAFQGEEQVNLTVPMTVFVFKLEPLPMNCLWQGLRNQFFIRNSLSFDPARTRYWNASRPGWQRSGPFQSLHHPTHGTSLKKMNAPIWTVWIAPFTQYGAAMFVE